MSCRPEGRALAARCAVLPAPRLRRGARLLLELRHHLVVDDWLDLLQSFLDLQGQRTRISPSFSRLRRLHILLSYLAWDLLIIHLLVISIDGTALEAIEGVLLPAPRAFSRAVLLVRLPLALGVARTRELRHRRIVVEGDFLQRVSIALPQATGGAWPLATSILIASATICPRLRRSIVVILMLSAIVLFVLKIIVIIILEGLIA